MCKYRWNSVLDLIACIALVLGIGFSLCQAVQAAAVVHYVAPGGACGGGTPCYASVQQAVNAAASGDVIKVAEGVYSGVNNQGGTTQHLYIDKDLTITGGYVIGNWSTSDPVNHPMELQAQTLGRVVFIAEGVEVTLEGLMLTWGNAAGLVGHYSIYGNKDAGGGVYVSKADLTLRQCQILDNVTQSDGLGGGLYGHESVITIIQTRFEDNSAFKGGGAYLYLADTTIQKNNFISNQATGMATGAFALEVDQGSLTFTENELKDNFTIMGAGSAINLSKVDDFSITKNNIVGTADDADACSKHCSGIGLSYSTGLFAENYVANHRDKGISVFAGYVTLQGNEITGNQGRGASSGGGVSFDPSPLTASEFSMLDNHIHHNIDRYLGCGGGVFIKTNTNSIAILDGNLIEANLSGDGVELLNADGNGGGVCINGDEATLNGNIIRENTANSGVLRQSAGEGGGVYLKGDSILSNNIIAGNQAGSKGSGVFVIGSAPTLYHNTFYENQHPTADQSAVYATESNTNVPGQPRLYNNIIANQGIGIYAEKGDVKSTAVVDGILWFNNTENTGGLGTVFVTNGFTGDPLFLDAVNGDFHISAGSAAIDRGIVTPILKDFDGQPRSGAPDLGADEYWEGEPPDEESQNYLPLIVR